MLTFRCRPAAVALRAGANPTALRRGLSTPAQEDLRTQLRSKLSSAMKAKDKFATTVLKGVLADVNAAEKTASAPLSTAAFHTVLRKNATKRRDAAKQFQGASRNDLAEQETREADFIESLLPPLLSQEQVDGILQEIFKQLSPSLAGNNPKKSMGLIMKTFYQKVPASEVDGFLLKTRVETLLDSINKPLP